MSIIMNPEETLRDIMTAGIQAIQFVEGMTYSDAIGHLLDRLKKDSF